MPELEEMSNTEMVDEILRLAGALSVDHPDAIENIGGWGVKSDVLIIRLDDARK